MGLAILLGLPLHQFQKKCRFKIKTIPVVAFAVAVVVAAAVAATSFVAAAVVVAYACWAFGP